MMMTSVWHDWGPGVGRMEVNGPDLRGPQCPAKRAGLSSSYKEPIRDKQQEIIRLY